MVVAMVMSGGMSRSEEDEAEIVTKLKRNDSEARMVGKSMVIR